MPTLFSFARRIARQLVDCRWLLGLIVLHTSTGVCRAESVIHWTNSALQDGVSVINSGAVFTTDFKGSNDVKISKPSGSNVGLFNESLGGATPGNNPAWVTNFVGSTAQQTGNGTPGVWTTLETSSGANTEQFDFSIPLGPGDRMLVFDVDNTEKYQIAAYTLVGGNYVAAPLSGWTHQAFSGETGITPDARWPVWSPADGTLTATGNGLGEPIDVFAPDQNIDRVVFIDLGSGSGTPALQFAANVSQVNLLCDYNQNGVVNAADYVLWHSGGPLANEVDTPGTVNSADYTAWRARFGNTSASGSSLNGGAGVSSSTAVPEPSSVLALLLGTFLIGMRRSTWRAECLPNGPSQRPCNVSDKIERLGG